MAFALSGVPQAVATCGTALADEHFQILKNLARKVILAYDADAAGQAAAERCYQWEQKFEVQFQVADLPAGPRPGRRLARRPRAARQGRQCGDRVPPVPHRPGPRRGRPLVARGPGPRRGGSRAGAARAPERARARGLHPAGRRNARRRARVVQGRDRAQRRAPRPHVEPRHDRCRPVGRPAGARRPALVDPPARARRRLARRVVLRRSARARGVHRPRQRRHRARSDRVVVGRGRGRSSSGSRSRNPRSATTRRCGPGSWRTPSNRRRSVGSTSFSGQVTTVPRR